MRSHESGIQMPEVFLAERKGEIAPTPHSARHLGQIMVFLFQILPYAEPNFPLISQTSNIWSICLLSFKALFSKTETTVFLNCFSSTGEIITSRFWPSPFSVELINPARLWGQYSRKYPFVSCLASKSFRHFLQGVFGRRNPFNESLLLLFLAFVFKLIGNSIPLPY